MLKFEKVTNLLRKRIASGDYMLTGLPVEERLASEVGVSRITIRKAINVLVMEGLLKRGENGRLSADIEGPNRRLYVAFLSPAYDSESVSRYRMAMESISAELNMIIRPIEFTHWADPVISDTLERLDGVVLVPSPEPAPKPLFERIRQGKTPVVVLGWNCSEYGIPSMSFGPPEYIRLLLAHFKELQHKKVDFLNTQPMDQVIQNRIACWRDGLAKLGLEGELFNLPVEPYQSALKEARRFVGQMLDDRRLNTHAMLCSTESIAIGAIRACYERGVQVGRDFSIASVSNDALSKDLCPAITSLDMVDPAPFFRECLQWIRRGGRDWTGPLHLQPGHVPIFIGESTGLCPHP